MITETASPIEKLMRAPRRGEIELVDVPAIPYLMCDGCGRPDAGGFQEAIQALYSISYGAKFALKQRGISTSRMGPLETLWDTVDWETTGADSDQVRWTAMIAQPPEVDDALVAEVAADAAERKRIQVAPRVVLKTWEEGLAAQLLHVGAYAAERENIARLHAFIASQGLRSRGRHHEIYLSDPRRTAVANLRTIIRQPVERMAAH
jgi:hypothetical protein